MTDIRNVGCPKKPGYYFKVSYCLERRDRGDTPCNACQALDNTLDRLRHQMALEGISERIVVLI